MGGVLRVRVSRGAWIAAVATAAVIAACSDRVPSSATTTATATESATESARSADGLLPPLPDGLRPIGHGDAPSPEACAKCHAEIVDEWRASFHRRSWTNPWFTAGYRAEPRAFCRGCHAPMSGGDEPAPRAEDEGVTCATCHGGQTIVSSGRHPKTDAHATIVDPRRATSQLCAGCHEFSFQSHADGEASSPPMQATCSEAAGSGQCQSCHMPVRIDGRGRRYRSHRFDGTSKAMLERALSVSAKAQRIGDAIEVTLTLRARSGHAVPTGDLFRALELSVVAGDRRAVVMLSRTFRFVPGRDDDGHVGFVRRDERDLRVLPGKERVVKLRVRAAPGVDVAWSIAHLRTAPSIASTDGVDVGRTVFIEGRIAPWE